MRHANGHINVFGNQVRHAVVHRQRYLYLGIPLRELHQQRHQVALPQRARAGDAQLALHLVLVLFGELLNIGQGAVNVLRLCKHLLANLGQGQAPGRALHQARTQLVFQPRQLARQNRLADAQLGCRLADAAGLHDGAELGQALRFQGAHGVDC